jgi:hypothetical protein
MQTHTQATARDLEKEDTLSLKKAAAAELKGLLCRQSTDRDGVCLMTQYG